MNREQIVHLDKRHVWHPYTPMQKYIAETDPIVVARASGPRFYDTAGKGYLDANSSWWVATLGHAHPRLVEALKRQASVMPHVSLAGVTHEGAARLAAELVERSPELPHVFYSDDGSTALEAAIKMALKLHVNEGKPEKSKFVAIEGAFHGETIGVTALNGMPVFRRSFASALMPTEHVPSPASSIGEEAAFRALEELLRRDHAIIAALVVEPLVQGADGMLIHSPAYLRRAHALCRELDVLFIADEVFVGYGRTGSFWACDQANIAPDLICTAKGFSGGILPMAATLASKRVFDAFLGAPENAFFYGHSYCGHPLGAAVALEVLAVYREEKILEGIPERSRRIRESFERIAKKHPGCKKPRGLGMVGAIDLQASSTYLDTTGGRVFEAAKQRGAYLRPLGDTVYVAPPLNIPLADLDELMQIVEDSVTAVLEA